MRTTSITILACAVIIGCLASLATAQPSDAAPEAAAVLEAPEAPAAPPAAVEPAVAPEVTPAEKAEEDPMGTAVQLVQDIKSGNWRMVAAAVLAFLMLGLAKVRDKVKFFSGDRGGAILVGILGLAGAISSALATDTALDWKLFVGAMGVTWTAVGGYSWIKKLWKPADHEVGSAEA